MRAQTLVALLPLFLSALLSVSTPLPAQTVDTNNVTITYTGSSSPNTATVHVTNAANVTARIGTNIDATGALVSSAGNTPGVFVQNVSASDPTSAQVNIGTDPNVLAAIARRGPTTYTGATLLISATGCNDCISVALTLQITNGGGIAITYNGAPVPAGGITLFSSVGGSASAQLTLTSLNSTAYQVTSNQPWLTVNPSFGQLSGSATVTLTANGAGLPSGSNLATLQVIGGGVTTNITVTLNVGTGSGLTLSPNPMNFSYNTSTGGFPSGQTQFLTVSGASNAATYNATAISSPQWLRVGSGGGTSAFGISTLSQLPVSVNPAVLNLNTTATYTGQVQINTSDGLSAILNVNFAVSPGAGGNGTLTFTVAAPGGAAPLPQQLTISGSGIFTAFVGTNNCGQGWLQVSPTNGQLSAIGTPLTVQVFPGNIGTGTCTGTISISTTGVLQNGTNFEAVNVTMQIGSGSGGGGTVASPASLSFTVPPGGIQSQTLIVNGDGSAFTAQTTATNLVVFPTSGSTPAILTVIANSSSSSGTITVSSSLGAQNVGVTVSVVGGNVLSTNPASLSFVYTPGSGISAQNLSVNASQDGFGSHAVYSVASVPPFMSYSVSSAVTPASIGVNINTAQLGPGFNTGNIVLTASNVSNSTLNIPVTVLAPGASSSGLVATPNPVNLSAQQFGAPVSQTVSLGGLNAITFTVNTASSGNWLSVNPAVGITPTSFTVTANPAALFAQVTPYQGTVTVNASNGTTLNIPVNLTVSAANTPTAGSVNPASGTGAAQFMTFTFNDPRGFQDLGILNILINNGLDAQHACYLAYINSISTLALVNDAGNAGGQFAGTLVYGSPAVISNSQCSVSLVSVVGSGTTLTLQLNVGFAAGFAGSHIVFLAARDQAQNNSGWQSMGVWQVPGIPNGSISVNGMSPARGQMAAGTAQTYSFTWTDTKGLSDLGILNILVNNGLDGAHACYLAYVATGNANTLFLVDDQGDAGGPFAGSVAVGAPQTIQNSQCIVNSNASSAIFNGTSVTLNLNITFKSGFQGNRVVFLAGRDSNSLNNTGWQASGTVGVQ